MKQRGFALVAAMLLPAAGVNHQPAFTLSAPPNELFATAVQGAGDADGDGRGDLLVYSFAMAGQHFVRLFSGLDGSLIHRFGPVMNGPTFYPGPPCAGVGDVDGDGFDDVIVGDSGSNRALVFSGLDASLIYELRPELLQPYDRFGGAVAGAGDVDGDGVGDLVVGCTGYRVGYVNVYSGADGALLFSLTHSEPGVEFGAAVAGAGDVDGDGRADVVVGAPGDGRYIVVPGLPPFVPPFKRVDQSGAVRVYSGLDGALLFTAFGDHEYDGLGFSVSSAGDVDGDGRADVVAGTRSTDDPQVGGYARVLSGAGGAVLHTFLQGLTTHPTQVRVSGVGDLDGDGHAELLVGSTSPDPTHPDVQVFSGATGASLFTFSSDSGVPTTHVSVSGVGDANADGTGDFLVGIAEWAYGAGYARLFTSQ